MPVDPVASAGNTALYTGASRAPKQEMDGELFMSLLVTQLQNQDPSSPMDTTEMINQTTQLAMMEKLNMLSSNAEESFSLNMRSSAADLLGREVTYSLPDGGTTAGTVSSVSYSGPVPQVMVDGKWTALDSIAGITDGAAL